MSRLTDPDRGTVVRCEGDLAAYLVSLGWADADAPAQQDEAPSDEPQTVARRPRKPRN